MNQVHKESLDKVENALPNRQGLDIEIFGMEGVPDDIVQQHNQRIITNFYTAQAERHAATGNPPPGQAGGQGPAKKIKIETPEELKKRLADHRAKVAQIKANGGTLPVPVVVPKSQQQAQVPVSSVSPVAGQSPAQGVSFIMISSNCCSRDTDMLINTRLRHRHPPSLPRNQDSRTPHPSVSPVPSHLQYNQVLSAPTLPSIPLPAQHPHCPVAPVARRASTSLPGRRAALSRRDHLTTTTTTTTTVVAQCRHQVLDTPAEPRLSMSWCLALRGKEELKETRSISLSVPRSRAASRLLGQRMLLVGRRRARARTRICAWFMAIAKSVRRRRWRCCRGMRLLRRRACPRTDGCWALRDEPQNTSAMGPIEGA